MARLALAGWIAPVLVPLASAQDTASQRPLLAEAHRTFPADANYATEARLFDADGDGDLDAVLATFGPVTLRWNDGLGHFGDSSDLTSPAAHLSVAVGDLDGNLTPDLVVGTSAANLVLLNDGLGNFTESVGVLPVSTEQSVVIELADVDMDGDLDVFVGNANDFTPADELYINDGTGVFSDGSAQLPAYVSHTQFAAFADVDGDGDPDLLTQGANRETVLLLNNGEGRFRDSTLVPGASIPALLNVGSIALGDLDGDGDLDAFVAAWTESVGNAIWLNDGAGSFTDASAGLPDIREYSVDVALGDLDGDGDLDAYVTNTGVCALGSCVGRTTGQDHVYLNDGNASFVEEPDVPAELQLDSSVSLGDVDGDGDLDALITTSDMVTTDDRLYLGRGDGSFVDVTVESGFPLIEAGVFASALADTDGDGDLDLILGLAGANRLYLNHLPEPFVEAVGKLPPAKRTTLDLASGDVDGDGDPDLLVANDGLDRLYRNDGGTFVDVSGTQFPLLGQRTTCAALVDVDADGDLDAVLGMERFITCRLLLNDGAGLFTLVPNLPTGSEWVEEIVAADLDGDGDPDLLVGSQTSHRVWRNDGAGVFTDVPGAVPASMVGARAIAVGDLDGDGDLDFMGGTFNGKIQLGLNDGTGIFTDEAARVPNRITWDRSIELFDVDEDGDLDCYADGNAGILYTNDGSANFTDQSELASETGRSSYDTSVGDVDEDGDLDVFVANNDQPVRFLRSFVRHLGWHNPPAVGKTARLDLYGPPSTSAVLAYSLASARIELGVGILRLAPASLVQFAVVPLDASGAGSTEGMIPLDPGFVGLSLFWQAWFPSAGRLSNADLVTVGTH